MLKMMALGVSNQSFASYRAPHSHFKWRYPHCRLPRSTCCSVGKGFGPAQESPNVVTIKAKSEKELKTMGKWIAKELSSTSIVIIGDDEVLNKNLTRAVSPLLGYTPLYTSQLLEQLTGNSVSSIVEDEGPDALGAAEAVVMESLSNYVRCVIATCGGGIGASARSACWRHFYGAITIWLDVQSSEGESRPQDEAYGLAELHVKISRSKDDETDEVELAKVTMRDMLPALKALLKQDKELCKKKGLYVRLGCRGDWPSMQPPEWAPDGEPQA